MGVSDDRLRILHIALGGCLSAPPIPYGLTEDTGGHIAYVLGAAMAQADLADVAHVTIVTRGFQDARFDPRYARAVEPVGPGCTIRRLISDRNGYLDKGALEAELPSLRDAFLRLLETDGPPDVIHAHFADAALLAKAAQDTFGTPWVYTPHSLGIDKFDAGCADNGLHRRIERERAAIRSADAIVTSSRDEAERQVAVYDFAAQGRVYRVDPGVDRAAIRDVAPARRLVAPFLRDPDKPIVLAIARPVEKKNLTGVVRGFASDLTLRDRANLVVLAGLRQGLSDGGAEQRKVMAELFDLVDRNDLWGSVALPRHHSQAEVHALYALASRGGVFVSPALHEPFGLTIVEAAQAGVPVVATRKGGPSTIVAEIGAGALVNPRDDAAIGRAIRHQLDARPDDTERAKARATQLYSWPNWARRVDTIYRGLPRRPALQDRPDLLIASDIDDTLTGDRAGARDFARWLSDRPHLRFAAVTGRCVSEARRVLDDWGLPQPAIWMTSVGTEIWRPAQRGGLTLCHEYASLIANGWDADVVDRTLRDLCLLPQDAYERRPWKRSFLGEASLVPDMRHRLAEAGIAARVIASHGRFIDVIPARAGKANAVRFELERLGLPRQNCIVAGDSGNDADMLAEMPLAVIPSNGRAEIGHLAHPGLYRASRPHAPGVIEGIEALTVPTTLPVAAE